MSDSSTGLFLTVSLFKDGARWDGDTLSTKWAECLIVVTDEHIQNRVKQTLSAYKEGEDYKVERDCDGLIACVWVK